MPKKKTKKRVSKRLNKPKKKCCWNVILMILYWALYLTVTMALFEHFHITPLAVPLGAIGWMFIVEVPRVLVGWLISLIFFKY